MAGAWHLYILNSAGGFDIYEEDDVKDDVEEVEQKELIGDAELLTPTQRDSLYKLDEAGSTLGIALVLSCAGCLAESRVFLAWFRKLRQICRIEDQAGKSKLQRSLRLFPDSSARRSSNACFSIEIRL